jgi:uncharacterized protein
MKELLIGINPCIQLSAGKFILLDLIRQEINLLEKKDLKNFWTIPKLQTTKKNSGKVILSTTYNCNLRCKYCYVRGGDLPIEMLDSKIAIRAVDFLLSKSLDEITIQFFGGEPTLNFNCIKSIVDHLKHKKTKTKINYEISTNGLLIEELLNFFLRNKFLFIVSLDGPKEIHNLQRPTRNKGTDSFLATKKTINLILQKTKKLKVRTTITSKSVEKMADIVKYFSGLGIKLIHFEVFNPLGRGKEHPEYLPDKDEYVRSFVKAYLIAKKLGIQITQFGIFDLFSPSKFTCASVHKYKFVVMPNGEILFCLGAQEEFGDIVKEFKLGYSTPERLFINEKKAIILPRKYNVDLIKKCDGCFIKYICKGVCPALNAVANKRWDIPDKYSCFIRRGIIKKLILILAKESFDIKFNIL